MQPVCKNNCRNGLIIERRIKRLAFAIRHKELILAAEYSMKKNRRKNGFSIKLNPIAQRLVDILKEEVPYSCRTVDYDIFTSMFRLLQNHLKTNKT